MGTSRAPLWLAGLLSLVGCGGAPDVSASPDAAASRAAAVLPAAAVSPVLRAAAAPPGPRVRIAAGSVLAGSRPGTRGRRPNREADLVPVDVPAFEIDRRPLLDARGIPLIARSVAEARQACASRDARLCDELEWERACEGDAHVAFPTGPAMDLEACTMDLDACTSAFGVIAPGVEAAEWTASSLEPASAGAAPDATVVVRGARFDQPLSTHRCDARAALAPVSSIGAAVRCCHGPPPDLSYPDIATVPTFADVTNLDTSQLREVLGSLPELAPYAPDFATFDADDAMRALSRGNATLGALAGWELASAPFRWSPSAGDELLVVTGHGGGSTLIAVLYRLVDGGYAHGASFVLAGQDTSIAVSRTPLMRAELHWTACFGCGGESGSIRLDDDGVVTITQF